MLEDVLGKRTVVAESTVGLIAMLPDTTRRSFLHSGVSFGCHQRTFESCFFAQLFRVMSVRTGHHKRIEKMTWILGRPSNVGRYLGLGDASRIEHPIH